MYRKFLSFRQPHASIRKLETGRVPRVSDEQIILSGYRLTMGKYNTRPISKQNKKNNLKIYNKTKI